MGDVIRIDFQKNRRREDEALERFEQAMRANQGRARFRSAGLMILLSFIIIGVMSIPFVVQNLTGWLE